MAKTDKSIAVADEAIINKIYFIRNKKVMLDRDLAELYDVTTSNLNKAVKRNLKRFPVDFMFQVTEAEFKNLIFQNGTSSWGGTRKMPYAFTEQGVAMLSVYTNSKVYHIPVEKCTTSIADKPVTLPSNKGAQIHARSGDKSSDHFTLF